MSCSSNQELRHDALSVFGRRLEDAEIDAYRGRLPTMIANVRILTAWAPKLGLTAPALIQRLPEASSGE